MARAVWGFFGILLAAVSAAKDGEELLIGWRGDTYKPQRQQERHTWIEHISNKPRAFIFHNFLTPEEARHVVDLAWPQMQRSTVVGPNGSSVLDDYRTSFGTFLNRYQDDVIKTIEDRVALITHVPVSHQEDIQVLRYGIGQYYHRHQDSLENDSPRMATLLVYLSDPEEGGETVFPVESSWLNPELEKRYGSEFSECGKGHVGIKPRRGDGLLFWSYEPDGHTDDIASTHEGCPVIKGAKWTTTFWIHTKPFRPEEFDPKTGRFRRPDPFVDPGLCRDAAGEARCAEWAKAGECTKNKQFMVGEGFTLGNCMRACGVCKPCAKDDMECYMDNRRRVGYLAFNASELDYRNPIKPLTLS